MLTCQQCNVFVTNKDLATVEKEIKVVCGNCPSEKGHADGSNGLTVAIFNRFNIYCFLCKKSGNEIKLPRMTIKNSIICVIMHPKKQTINQSKKKTITKMLSISWYLNQLRKIKII